MATDIVTTWRPGRWLPAQWRGSVAPGGDLAPRASWQLVSDALAGRVSKRWAAVRSVRLDGPRAHDATFEALAESGCLNHVETLHLASDGFSSRAVSAALALPALATLRLDGVSIPVLAAQPAARLRGLEFFQCSPDTCAAVLRAVGAVAAVDLDTIAFPLEHRSVWEALADCRLASLRIARLRCPAAALARALRGSGASLESLTLDTLTGLGSDKFLAEQSWPALRTLEWNDSKVAHLGAQLPETLTTLSLRNTTVMRSHFDDGWPSNLTSLDCVASTVSDTMAARINANPGTLTRLGLGASETAARTIATLSQTDHPLRSLELGDGRIWKATWEPGRPVVDAVPDAVESLAATGSWALDEDLIRDLLRGDRASGLRDLRFDGVNLGNPDLGGRFSPRLRRLELHGPGFLEGLGSADQPLALSELTLAGADHLEVHQDEFVSLLTRCEHLVSMRLEYLVGVDPDGLAAVLDAVGERLVRLELRGFSEDAVPAYGDALLASDYPALAELCLDRSMYSARAFPHLMDVKATPALERLELDYQAPDDQWLMLAGRAPSALHWIEGYYAGRLDAPHALLRDETVEVSAASIHLRTGD